MGECFSYAVISRIQRRKTKGMQSLRFPRLKQADDGKSALPVPWEFCNVYKKFFLNSYTRYSSLKNERLFAVIPTFVRTWSYIDGVPYIEILDMANELYEIKKYVGI